jgi:hypothetical protein
VNSRKPPPPLPAVNVADEIVPLLKIVRRVTVISTRLAMHADQVRMTEAQAMEEAAELFALLRQPLAEALQRIGVTADDPGFDALFVPVDLHSAGGLH